VLARQASLGSTKVVILVLGLPTMVCRKIVPGCHPARKELGRGGRSVQTWHWHSQSIESATMRSRGGDLWVHSTKVPQEEESQSRQIEKTNKQTNNKL